MATTARQKAGTVLATIGVVVWLIAIVFWVHAQLERHPYEMPVGIIILAGVIGFIGFYLLDPRGAEDAGGFIVGSGERILRVLPRFGRRSTDAVAVPEVKTEVTPQAVDEKDEASIERPKFSPGGA